MYGRDGELTKLDRERKDESLPLDSRRRASRAFNKISVQMKDKRLMSLRVRLIGAAQAGDAREQHKIQQQMRDYLKEPLETGLPD